MTSHGTPMMRQYRRVKQQIPPGTLLLFRLGDFYEMFFDDAKIAAGVLEIALTQRNGIPMCGVPYRAAEGYVARLVRAGYKVALCDQVEEAARSRGIVRRELTQVITAGTTISENLLHPARNNYLMACRPAKGRYGLAFLDLSTGEFRAAEIDSADQVAGEVARWRPAECLIPQNRAGDEEFVSLLRWGPEGVITPLDDELFSADSAEFRLTEHFGTESLDGFGLGNMPEAVAACGAVLSYVEEVLRGKAGHITSLGVYDAGEFVGLDADTQRNLDLLEDMRTGTKTGSLLGVLDATVTPMGGRLLRSWILRPLRRVEAIRRRQECVRWFAENASARELVRSALGEVRDLERTASRITLGHGGPRDLVSLADALAAVPRVRSALSEAAPQALLDLRAAVPEQPVLVRRIRDALVESPPALLREGGVFRDGYHPELDDLRAAATHGREWIASYQNREQERTGIRSLKVRYNKVFGYYIEVTKANLASIPSDYVRKQTLTNAERFITEELKDYETRIVGAEERARELEAELFQELRREVVADLGPVQRAARALAEIDVLAALAHVGVHGDYCLPVVDDGDAIEIREGRHPVIERMLETERFVPNDALINGTDHQILIITGPNMAGKSTYIRQVALLVLMAQIGSMIPAASARIGVVDRIFTRVGASDDLSRGRSTFMVEMHETANILNNATSRSLVVLDEIGRGTSTFDGISIAWAVAEYLHEEEDRRARTLFATHYHELTDLARSMKGVRNYNIAVSESGGRISFLRKIVPGPADKSYGIQVAQLAGLPERVIRRAREILATLEEGEFTETGQPRLAQRRRQRPGDSDRQLRFFE